jgi:nucleoside phosphorylase
VSIVVVLTALDLEYQAVRRHLVEARTLSHPSGTLFEVGHINGTAGTVALAVTGEGNIGAAVLAERAVTMFRPAALLCVGVAGSLKHDIALGDVVVATKIYAMHGGRVQADGFLARPRAWQAPHKLEQAARHVARTGAWTRLLPAKATRCPPAVHFKPIASGEIVLGMADTPLAALLCGFYDDAVAVEMESAGVAQAAHLNQSLPVLSVRGISDRADPGKPAHDASGWQHTAAEHAAAFTITMSASALHAPFAGTCPSTPGAQTRSPLRRLQRQCLR